MPKTLTRCIWVVLLLLAMPRIFAQNALSPQASVELLTISPGADLYSTFGHTALWIKDPVQGFDYVFNYGTFDFGEPTLVGQLEFGIKFARGKLPYMLSVHGMDVLLYGSQRDNRSVIAQTLNLTDAQKNRLFILLQENYKPENRYYHYDFFYDNCTTRVRDMLQKVCGDSLRFGQKIENLTFRQWIDRYARQLPWADFGMDLGVAVTADKPATASESMFLPDNLMKLTTQATVQRDGKMENFELENRIIYQAQPPSVDFTGFTPTVLLWLLLALGVGLTFWQWRGTGRQFWVDAIFFSLVGLLGWVLLLLWTATDHQATIRNWHLAWAWPLHLPLAWWLLKKHKPRWLRIYFIVCLAVLVLVLAGWKLIPQELDYALVPLVLLMALRSAFLVYRLRLSAQQAK